MDIGLWPKHVASLGANSMGKRDTATAQTEVTYYFEKKKILIFFKIQEYMYKI